jgi:hypothetical protein
MIDTADRYRRVAGAFTDIARRVPSDAWDNPTPCDGWVARDVVGHMVEWMPAFLEDAPIEIRPGPSVADDPLGAWLALSASLQAGLDGPKVEVPADADEQTRLIACTGRRP